MNRRHGRAPLLEPSRRGIEREPPKSRRLAMDDDASFSSSRVESSGGSWLSLVGL